MFPGSKSVPAVESKYVVKELFATVEFGDHTKPVLFHDGLFHAHTVRTHIAMAFTAWLCMEISSGRLSVMPILI